MKIKHVDKVKSDSYKLILNSVYGNFKSSFSKIYSPRSSFTICVYGQIAIFDLARMLFNAGYLPININTDGVAYIASKCVSRASEEVCKEWEQKYTGLVLEIDKFKKWIQKDVNNYVAVDWDDHIKTKGGDVNKYSDNKYFSNNSLRIVHIALVEYLINGTPPMETIKANLDKPELFQIVLKAGSTFKGVVDSNHHFQQKVNRVFAVREEVPHTRLYKLRSDDALVNFPDAPENMMLWNDDCKNIDLKDFKSKISKKYYEAIVKKKLEGWGQKCLM